MTTWSQITKNTPGISYLLMESGDYLLLESEDKIILNQSLTYTNVIKN